MPLKHWLEINLDKDISPEKDLFRYAGSGFVWFKCNCGHLVKINLNSEDVSFCVKMVTEQLPSTKEA